MAVGVDPADDDGDPDEDVHIAAVAKGRKIYHADRDCPSIKETDVKTLTRREAKQMWRRPCRICTVRDGDTGEKNHRGQADVLESLGVDPDLGYSPGGKGGGSL